MMMGAGGHRARGIQKIMHGQVTKKKYALSEKKNSWKLKILPSPNFSKGSPLRFSTHKSEN